jgi:site-specific recombinase XerD
MGEPSTSDPPGTPYVAGRTVVWSAPCMEAREDAHQEPLDAAEQRRIASLLAKHLTGVSEGPVFSGCRGHRLTARHANRILARRLGEAGIRLQGTHVLRHTFGTTLYRSTGDLLLVKEALGHRSISSTLIYAAPDNDRLRRVLLLTDA